MVKLIVVLLVAFSTQFPSENAFKIKPRIVHGDLATERQFPFYAYLNIKTNQDIFGCGGALLNEEFILTAAHCTYDAVQVDVHLGMENIDNPGHFTAVVGKQNIFVCPRFFIRIAYNDMSKLNHANSDFEQSLSAFTQNHSSFFRSSYKVWFVCQKKYNFQRTFNRSDCQQHVTYATVQTSSPWATAKLKSRSELYANCDLLTCKRHQSKLVAKYIHSFSGAVRFFAHKIRPRTGLSTLRYVAVILVHHW